MSKASAFVKLIRPVNCVMMGVAVIVGAALTGSLYEKEVFLQQLLNLTFGFLTGFFLTAATMTINDIHDREIDAINEPERPLPSGEVSPREAMIFAVFLTAVGFATSIFTNWWALIIASVAWIVFVLYTTTGKRWGFIGNLMVSICITTPFIYGGFVVQKAFLSTTSVFVAMVFLSNTGREITKGIVDVQGDQKNNVRTVAVIYGGKKAAVVAAIFFLSAVSLTPLPWLMQSVSFWFLPFVAMTDVGLVISSVLLLLNPSKENAKKTKNRNLVWFSLGLLGFLVGTIS